MTSRAVAGLLVVGVLLGAILGAVEVRAAAASDDGCGATNCSGAEAGDGEVEFGARVIDTDHVTSGEGPRSDGGQPPPCSFRATEPDFDVRDETDAWNDIPLWDAEFYWMDCGERTYLRWYERSASNPVTDGIVTEAVQAAYDTIGAEAPAMRLSPPADQIQLTGLPTWLAIAPDRFQRIEGSVTAGQVTVTAWLSPREVEWSTGTGDTLVCDGPGTTYQPQVPHALQSPACGYTYLTTPSEASVEPEQDRYRLTARVVYQAGYEIHGPLVPGTYDLGPVFGPVTETPVTVRQWRSVRTS